MLTDDDGFRHRHSSADTDALAFEENYLLKKEKKVSQESLG